MNGLVYKILTLDQWDSFARSGQFAGSDHDKSDGFIHLSSGPQLPGTLAKHYAKVDDIVLVGFEARNYGDELKWEVSRGGEKFPHLYVALQFSGLVNAFKLAQTPENGFVLPSNL